MFIRYIRGWSSRYVNEGRDDGNGHSILWSEINASWESFDLGILAIDGKDFREYNSSLGYTQSFGQFDCRLGLNAVTLESDADDLELHMEVNGALSGFTWALSGVHSKAMTGQFLTLSLERPITCLNERLTFVPGIHQGFDFGYRSEDYDGASHLEIGIECQYALTEDIHLITHLAHSWAQSDLQREGGKDLTWGGIALAAEF